MAPDLPQIACFDTAFHHDKPEVAARLALPRTLHEQGIRRYGFHGLSYEYSAGQWRTIDRALADGRVIAAHLGNGASLCAMRDGKSIDTTMGFSTLDGLMMGTRCGTLDPGVVLHLQTQLGMGADRSEEHTSDLQSLMRISSDVFCLKKKKMKTKHPKEKTNTGKPHNNRPHIRTTRSEYNTICRSNSNGNYTVQHQIT